MTASTHEGGAASAAPNPERMVPVKEACRYGRWSPVTLYKLIGEGKIDAYKDGGRTLIDLDSVDRYKRSLPKLGPKENAPGEPGAH